MSLAVLRQGVKDHVDADAATMALLPVTQREVYRVRRTPITDVPVLRYLDFGVFEYVGQVALAPRLTARTFSFDVVARDVDEAEPIAEALTRRMLRDPITFGAGVRLGSIRLTADREVAEADNDWTRRVLDFELKAYLST